jgi:hypothetical protein
MTRRTGHARLVFDKETQRIITRRTPLTEEEIMRIMELLEDETDCEPVLIPPEVDEPDGGLQD